MTDTPGRSEIASVLAGETIRYSQVWEDHALLEAGLDIGPDDDVLSITSAGDNALALLLAGARTVTAIDLNPAQTHFFRLKLAAIGALNLTELRCLLGLERGDRVGLVRRLEGQLPEDTLSFWRERAHVIDSGLLNAGRLEAYIAGFQAELGSAPIRGLLELDDLAAQRALFDQCFDADREAAFRVYFGRDMMAKQGRDPAQFKYVNEGDVGGYFFERFRYACTELPLRDNFYIASFLTGGYGGAVPPYLRSHEFGRLKGLLDRVTIVTDELERFVRTQPRGTFNKLNLSDVFEYMSAEAADHLLGSLAQWLRPRGRIAFWNLLVPRSSSSALRHRLTPLSELADRLWRRDRAWFYRAFHIEEVAS